jgi:hypothetical protein
MIYLIIAGIILLIFFVLIFGNWYYCCDLIDYIKEFFITLICIILTIGGVFGFVWLLLKGISQLG